MAELWAYHLTRRTLEATAPPLLERCLARGWRVTLRCGSPERAAALNAHLWTYGDESFLPHGMAEDGRAERQPVYLTAGEETPNAPDVLMLADGAAAEIAEMQAVERCMLVFDGGDEAALAGARAAWRAAVAAGLKAVYWAEGESGGWEKKRESDPSA